MIKQETRIRLKAYEHHTLDQSMDKIVETIKRTGASVSGLTSLPTECSLYTIIRATHKYKGLREQSKVCTHKCPIDIVNPTLRTVDALMKLDLPSSVSTEIEL